MSDPPRITAIVVDHPGDEDAMRVGTVPRPRLGPTELRLAVRAAGVNRADLLQRQGKYPPPPGSSEVLGLECAGEVVEVGREVRGWKTGDRAMALLAGGGYAAEAVAPAGCALPVPEALSWEEAAALPEVFLTAFLTIFEMARFAPGEVALVHGGGSGVGTAAITLVTRSGGRIAVTAGSEEKCGRCRAHGAGLAVNYR
jgi:tumor protein p53-inducible protein 3